MRKTQGEVSRKGRGLVGRIVYSKLRNCKNRANFQILLMSEKEESHYKIQISSNCVSFFSSSIAPFLLGLALG